MLKTITFRGAEVAVDYSIGTILDASDTLGVDITGLVELLTKRDNSNNGVRTVAALAVAAINNGAARTGGDTRVTIYDIYDEMSLNATFSNAIVDGLISTISPEDEVFTKPTETPSASAQNEELPEGCSSQQE